MKPKRPRGDLCDRETAIRLYEIIKEQWKDIEALSIDMKDFHEVSELAKELFEKRESLGISKALAAFLIYPLLTKPMGKAQGFKELLKAILEDDILKRIHDAQFKENELFPVFIPPKNIELKKEFALNFGNTAKIRERYPQLLTVKMTGGKALAAYLDEVDNWYNALQGEDLGNWVKLFAFSKAVRDCNTAQPDTINIQEITPGRFLFCIKADKEFFKFFICPDKKSGQFTTKAKTRFLKWLHDNQNAIMFPIVTDQGVIPEALRAYEYREIITPDKKTELVFIVDTNILDSTFKDYVSINIDEIDEIAELWEKTLTRENEQSADPLDLKAFSLNGFVDIPLKLLLTLKTIYSREGNYTNKTRDFTGNVQTLSKKHLDIRLGNLFERVQKHLIKRDRMKTAQISDIPKKVQVFILKTTFFIAVQRKWLLTTPNYKAGIYHFNINAGYFDKKETARRLKCPK